MNLLTSDWKQENPLGYVVRCFCLDPNEDLDEYRIFVDDLSALMFAQKQQELCNAAGEQQTWKIYPLFAGEPIDVKEVDARLREI